MIGWKNGSNGGGNGGAATATSLQIGTGSQCSETSIFISVQIPIFYLCT